MSAIAEALAHLARQTLGEGARIGQGSDMLRLVQALGDQRNRTDVQALAGFCRLFLRAYENYDYDPRRNGEAWLLQRLQSVSPRVVLDVGANIGSWSALAAELLPDASIHAFEPVPETFRALAAQAAALGGRVQAHAFGLADRDGEIELNVVEDDATLSSIVALHRGAQRRVACRMRRGDAFLAEQGIAHVDLLKIDVEGAEPLVLAGLVETLAAGRVDVIQFEYGRANILTKFLLRDFHQTLEPLGYRVGKLFPDRVDFRDYQYEHEDFVGPNFVAVRGARNDINDLLTRV